MMMIIMMMMMIIIIIVIIIVIIIIIIPNRNTCRKCKCPRDVHDILIKSEVGLLDRICLELKGPEKYPTERDRAHRMGYSWVPAGLDKLKVSWPQPLLFS